MRIESVRAFPVGVRLDRPLRWGAMSVGHKGGIVVRVRTDDGLEGIGEAGFSVEYWRTVGPLVNEVLAPLIVGEDARDVGALWKRMFDATHMWGRRGVETYALSGVDIALWDLLGKASEQPVYRLLGAVKDSAPAYYAPSLKTADEIVPESIRAVEQGFGAIKLRVDRDVDHGIALVERVREEVGGEVELAVDANMAYDRRTAQQVATRLASLGVTWLEEPVLCHSLTQYVDEHSWLADRVEIRLAGGESLFTRYEFTELVSRRTFDVLQPDCAAVGGISEAKRIADLASAANLVCVPHIGCSSGTAIGLAAGLHVVLACANAPLVEYDAYGGPGWDGLLVDPPTAVDGVVHASDRPGLGIEIDEDAFAHYALLHRVDSV